jgi:hypothetical protein
LPACRIDGDHHRGEEVNLPPRVVAIVVTCHAMFPALGSVAPDPAIRQVITRIREKYDLAGTGRILDCHPRSPPGISSLLIPE